MVPFWTDRSEWQTPERGDADLQLAGLRRGDFDVVADLEWLVESDVDGGLAHGFPLFDGAVVSCAPIVSHSTGGAPTARPLGPHGRRL